MDPDDLGREYIPTAAGQLADKTTILLGKPLSQSPSVCIRGIQTPYSIHSEEIDIDPDVLEAIALFITNPPERGKVAPKNDWEIVPALAGVFPKPEYTENSPAPLSPPPNMAHVTVSRVFTDKGYLLRL